MAQTFNLAFESLEKSFHVSYQGMGCEGLYAGKAWT